MEEKINNSKLYELVLNCKIETEKNRDEINKYYDQTTNQTTNQTTQITNQINEQNTYSDYNFCIINNTIKNKIASIINTGIKNENTYNAIRDQLKLLYELFHKYNKIYKTGLNAEESTEIIREYDVSYDTNGEYYNSIDHVLHDLFYDMIEGSYNATLDDYLFNIFSVENITDIKHDMIISMYQKKLNNIDDNPPSYTQ